MAGCALQGLVYIGMQAGLYGNLISYLRMAAQAQIPLDRLQRLVAPAAILFKIGVRIVPCEHNPCFFYIQCQREHGLITQRAWVEGKPTVPP